MNDRGAFKLGGQSAVAGGRGLRGMKSHLQFFEIDIDLKLLTDEIQKRDLRGGVPLRNVIPTR